MKRRFTLLATIFVSSVMLAHAQFVVTTLNNKTVISMVANGDTVFAGTYTYGVYRSTDQGLTWTQQINGLNNLNVWGLSVHNNTIYAGTEGGAFMSTDNGANWTSITSGLEGIYAIYDFVFLGTDILTGTLNSVFKSTNNGTHWNWSSTGIISSSNKIQSLVSNGSACFAGSYNLSGVYYSADTGATWTSIGLTDYPIRCMGMNGNNLFVGTSDTLYYTNDNGANWKSVMNGIGSLNHWTLSFAFNGSTSYAGTRGGGVYKSTDNGDNWTFVGTGLPAGSYVNKLVLTSNYIFAGTDYGQGVWRRSLSQLSTAINEAYSEVEASIYPNPVHDKLTIEIAGKTSGKTNFVLFNALGAELKNSLLTSESTVDVSTINPGLYFYQLKNDGGILKTGKVIIE